MFCALDQVNGMDSSNRRAVFAAPAGERDRDSLFLLANLRRVGETISAPVRVRNLSPGGLMAELDEPIDPDQPIEIQVRGLGWIAGRVAWHTEGRTGIAFDRLIDPQRARKPVGVVSRRKGASNN